jgi:hypothetical protein
MLSILRKARLKDKELRILMLYAAPLLRLHVSWFDTGAAVLTMQAKPPSSKG